MTRKTKADLEREVAELQQMLINCETSRINEDTKEPPASSFLQQWGPAILLAAALGAFVWLQRGDNPGPGPDPGPDQTIEAVTEGVFQDIRTGYSKTFMAAAERVNSGEIKSDQELFQFVQPALIELRIQKQRPFDQIFHLSLPRGEDGSFAGKEAEVSEFLLRIAKSW